METASLLTWMALLLGLYMSWNIGANDVANAMGTSVGSKALSLRRAVLLAAVLEFSGAFFVGSSVSETIQKGIIDLSLFEYNPTIFILGMLGSLLATGVLLQLASYYGLPVSTTHAIVGAVLGFGLAIGGMEAIHWGEVAWIAASWIVSPLLSGIIAHLIFRAIQQKILYALNPIQAAQKLTPFFVFLCISVVTLSLFSDRLADQFHLSASFILFMAMIIGLFASLLSYFLVQKASHSRLQTSDGFHLQQAVSLEKSLHHFQRVHLSNRNEVHSEQISHILAQMRKLSDSLKKNSLFHNSAAQYQGVEKIFIYLQILSACLVAFAHGANDVANAIGPVAAVLGVLKTHTMSSQSDVPGWLLALGGGGIVIGLATWGWRVIETVGNKITELTPTRGFSAEFGAAFTILLASKLGLPISTTHALVGAVLGVGMARGIRALNLQTLKEIVVSWIVTIPLCACFSIAAFYFLKWLFI